MRPVKSDAQARAGRFGHLAVDQRAARLFRIAGNHDARFLHFEPQVVSFARALAHSGENRHAAVLHGDVVNQFLNQHRLADARAAEKADLAALQVRLDQVDDLDARLEHFKSGGLIFERRRGAVNRVALFGFHFAELVDGLAENVEHAAKRRAAHRDGNRLAEVFRFHAADQAFGRLHGDAAHAALAQVLLDFGNDVDGLGDVESLARDAHGVVNQRKVAFFELHVDDRADHFDQFPYSVRISHVSPSKNVTRDS